jgi:hypothetical protein
MVEPADTLRSNVARWFSVRARFTFRSVPVAVPLVLEAEGGVDMIKWE